MTTTSSSTSVWHILADAMRSASPAVRAQMWWMLGGWIFMLLLQGWDSRNNAGVAGFAEFFSAVLGVTGTAFLAIAHSLHLTMQEVAARRRPTGDTAAVEHALIAMPAVAFAAGVTLSAAVMMWLVRWALGVRPILATIAVILFGTLMLVAGRIVVRSARTLYQHATQQAALAAAARSAATAARLSALQARMNPHFLFNALNTVASFVRTDPRRAEHVVDNLADVLRRTLDHSAATLTTVDDEIKYLRSFLALEQLRAGDRLHVAWDIDPDAAALTMPPLVLQPLVENALRHGIGSRIEGGTITITARRCGSRLELAVADDGDGFAPGWTEGIGLGNLRQRLATLFGSDAHLGVDRIERGARVTVTMPCAC